MLNKPQVDMVATYLDSDIEFESMLPFIVREYWRQMKELPAARFVYESVRRCGTRATMEALRDHDMSLQLKMRVYKNSEGAEVYRGGPY